MKKYNIQNYNRYQADLKQTTKSIPTQLPDHNLTRDDLVVKYMPLVENLARKFSTSETASGILDITDMIQEGNLALIKAVDKLDIDVLMQSKDSEKTLKSFISKRVKGAIRRAININRGSMKIPEYKLNELRSLDLDVDDDAHDPRLLLFYSQVFESFDGYTGKTGPYGNHQHYECDIPDNRPVYITEIVVQYLLGVMKKYLSQQQYEVLRLSYGLDVPKMSAIQIAAALDMNMATASVRVSQIKREAIDILIANTSPDEIFEIVD